MGARRCDEWHVFEAVESKNAKTFTKLADFLEKNDSPTKAIKRVSIDISADLIHGCSKHLPNTSITFDRFHVIKIVNQAMDELRRAEKQAFKEHKNYKYTFLKNPETRRDNKALNSKTSLPCSARNRRGLPIQRTAARILGIQPH